jgi:DNA-binding response OmpR family regulator
MRVLIVEDERILAKEIKSFLEKASYICDIAPAAAAARTMMLDNEYDFILLDLGLPDEDGIKLLNESKTISGDASYVIITARGNVDDRIKGLDLGADDYLAKPFSLLELQSRMQAISRRKSGNADPEIVLGEFSINLNKRTVLFGQTGIELSKKEFDLLSYMLLHKNRPLTRMQLSEHIWGSFSDDDYDSNFIDVHIKNIRKKMGAYAALDWLQTLRGIGYKIKL